MVKAQNLNFLFYLMETINKLVIFERRVMRKIFGPTRLDDGYCMIKTNREINDI
jgi:ribosomal protein S28E/S33